MTESAPEGFTLDYLRPQPCSALRQSPRLCIPGCAPKSIRDLHANHSSMPREAECYIPIRLYIRKKPAARTRTACGPCTNELIRQTMFLDARPLQKSVSHQQGQSLSWISFWLIFCKRLLFATFLCFAELKSKFKSGYAVPLDLRSEHISLPRPS